MISICNWVLLMYKCRSLGKVFNTPEVARVYIGSFWDSPLHFDMNRRLFELEEQDLFKDIQSLPRNAALRKLNDLIKRARLAKVCLLVFQIFQIHFPKHSLQHLDSIDWATAMTSSPSFHESERCAFVIGRPH